MKRIWGFLLLEGVEEGEGEGAMGFWVPRGAGAIGANDLGCWKGSGGIGIFGFFLYCIAIWFPLHWG